MDNECTPELRTLFDEYAPRWLEGKDQFEEKLWKEWAKAKKRAGLTPREYLDLNHGPEDIRVELTKRVQQHYQPPEPNLVKAEIGDFLESLEELFEAQTGTAT